jgi:hypothetical protein
VAASIAHFISLEVGNLIGSLGRLRFLAALRDRTFITVFRMETVIHVAMESSRAMKPRASTNEYTSRKPFRAIVAVRSTAIRSDVIVSIGTFRGCSDFYADLSL